VDRVRGAKADKPGARAEEPGTTSGLRPRAVTPLATHLQFPIQEPSSVVKQRAAQETAEQGAKLLAELEVTRAELLRKEQELEALKSKLELTREENDQLRTSLRCSALSGAMAAAPPVAGYDAVSDVELEVEDASVGNARTEHSVLAVLLADFSADEAPTRPGATERAELVAPESRIPPLPASTPPLPVSVAPPLVSTAPPPVSAAPPVSTAPPPLPVSAAPLSANIPPLPGNAPPLQLDFPPLPTLDRGALQAPARFDFGDSDDAFPVLRNVVLSAGARSTEPPSERRGSLRHACDIEVEFADETHFFAGLTQDISRGGLFVTTYHLLPVGSRLNLRFELPDGTEIQTVGQVRWVLDTDSESRPGIGIEFVDPPHEMLERIAVFCATRPPLYFDTTVPPNEA
jgi:uncharacterized protein (TIGR02266 family)